MKKTTHRLLRTLGWLILVAGAAQETVAAENTAARPAPLAAANARFDTHVQWDPAAKTIQVRLGGNRPVSLAIRQRWFLIAGSHSTPIRDFQAEAPRQVSPGEIAWVEQSPSARVRLEYSLRAEDGIACWARVVRGGSQGTALDWEQEISGLLPGGTLFAPSSKSLYPLAGQEVSVGYRTGGEAISIPMATWMDEKADLGLTIAAQIAMPVPGFRLQTGRRPGTLVLSRRTPVLEPGQPREVRHYFVRHAGDWRPGLAWVRDKFPRFFMLSNPALVSTHGCFVYSHEADEALCDEWVREGLRNLEIHFTYSHLGKYFPEEQPWIKAIDDKWSWVKRTSDPAAPREDAPYEQIKRYMAKVVESRGSFESVRGFIRRLKTRGIHSYCYFQPTESWEFFANDYFKDCILRHADGRPATTWYDHVQMDCRPETAWGQYLCRQLEQLLDALPEVDGIFMDQSAGDRADYAVARITDRLARIAEARGKLLYWNGPYQVELIEHATGMLAEAGAAQGEMIKYLTIGNKVCCGMGTSERQYQRNLLNGLWPSAPSLLYEERFRYDDDPATFIALPAEAADLHRRYMYLYQLYPGKVWYLGAHALEAPAGLQANIFQRPDGDYLVPLIAPGRTMASGADSSPVRVTVRIPDAAAIKGVYARTPETPGRQFAAAWSTAPGSVEIRLPWLGSAALVWISKSVQPGGAAPAPPPAAAKAGQAAASAVMAASIRCEGIVSTGAVLRVKTTAPMPALPLRKCRLNGHELGLLSTRNYRSWHGGVGIGVPVTILSFLKRENELVIEPAGPQEFIAIRNLVLSITLADGRTIASEPVRQAYCSYAGPAATGVIGSPLRIPLRFPRLEEALAPQAAGKP